MTWARIRSQICLCPISLVKDSLSSHNGTSPARLRAIAVTEVSAAAAVKISYIGHSQKSGLPVPYIKMFLHLLGVLFLILCHVCNKVWSSQILTIIRQGYRCKPRATRLRTLAAIGPEVSGAGAYRGARSARIRVDHVHKLRVAGRHVFVHHTVRVEAWECRV